MAIFAMKLSVAISVATLNRIIDYSQKNLLEYAKTVVLE